MAAKKRSSRKSTKKARASRKSAKAKKAAAARRKTAARKSRKSAAVRRSRKSTRSRKSRFSRKSRRKSFDTYFIEQNLQMSKPFTAEFRFVGTTAAGNASDKVWTLTFKDGRAKVSWGKAGGSQTWQTIGKAEALRRVSAKLGKGYKLVDLT